MAGVNARDDTVLLLLRLLDFSGSGLGLLILEGYFVADESKVLSKNFIEVRYFVSGEYEELYED